MSGRNDAKNPVRGLTLPPPPTKRTPWHAWRVGSGQGLAQKPDGGGKRKKKRREQDVCSADSASSYLSSVRARSWVLVLCCCPQILRIGLGTAAAAAACADPCHTHSISSRHVRERVMLFCAITYTKQASHTSGLEGKRSIKD